MHELIHATLRRLPGPIQLARFPLDDGALVGGFSGLDTRPWFVAKTALAPAGIERLRAEAAALRWLDPHAETLGIPRLLGWSEAAWNGPDPPMACLVQSGLGGAAAASRWRWRDPWSPLPASTHVASAWLRCFQLVVAPPRALTLTELDAEIRGQVGQAAERAPQYAPALLSLLAAAPALSFRDAAATLAVHGDFWSGNVRLEPQPLASRWRLKRRQPGKIGVLDWNGFDAGTALEDLLNWILHLELDPLPPHRLAGWHLLFFAPGSAREHLRAAAALAGYGETRARWAFFMFLLRRMIWELGLAQQSRSPAERGAAYRDWSGIVDWMDRHRYPDPFTPMPV